MWWMWLAEIALAGQVFVNGAPIDPAELAGTTLDEAHVRFDENGDVHIEAAGPPVPELVDVVPAGKADAPPAGPAEPAEPVVAEAPAEAPGDAAAEAGRPAKTASGQGGSAWPDASGRTAPLSRLTARGMHPSGVPEARWWLVVEDDGSRGHTIEILINGELVETVRSGEIPRILDVGAHLVPGENRILLRSTSTQASGGPLYVYLGSGNDRDGTVMIEQPEVQFALGASRSGTYQREYTVTVD